MAQTLDGRPMLFSFDHGTSVILNRLRAWRFGSSLSLERFPSKEQEVKSRASGD